jgi:transcriptional antiterminator
MKRTPEQVEAHQEHAKQLLDMGLQKADVAATLQRKYGLSRATAYRDIDEADILREKEDHTIEADPMPEITLEDREPLMRMTKHLLIDAYEQGNVQDYARLVREYERLARMGGLSQKF